MKRQSIERRPRVSKIIELYLKEKGFCGLVEDGGPCCCTIEDLLHCDFDWKNKMIDCYPLTKKEMGKH